MYTKNLNFFLETVCLSTNFDLRLKKLENFFGRFQNYVKFFFVSPAKKNASHTISFYENCMIRFFFKIQKPRFFHHQNAFIRIKHVWNCTISIFGVWWSTREVCKHFAFCPKC